jgi:hypothetical protein
MSILAEILTPDGRRVELTAERWRHIIACDRHPELADLQDDVLRAVTQPTRTRSGREPDETWFYLHGVGPSQWLKVVVVFKAERGYIVTAFPRRRLP